MLSHNRMAVTLIELLVVLAILAGMIGILLPAVQRARESGRSAVCQNNLRQLRIAAESHRELAKEFPVQGESWTVTLLQWIEERPLMEALKSGRLQNAVDNRPPIYSCPSQPELPANDDGALPCHYTLQARKDRKGNLVPALPIRDRTAGFEMEKLEPWYIGPFGPPGPENKGPHSGEYN